MKWIPIDYIFKSSLLDIVRSLFTPEVTRLEATNCLKAITSLVVKSKEKEDVYRKKIVECFSISSS